ncbi:MAG TPA: chorismate mutase [Solirubrobacteraceae bacterium]|nr:chorismate mutase [Solirubrobacteraceae bacterium]
MYAVRGAITVEHNDAGEILAATERLVGELMARNGLTPAELISCIFTVTDDLDAAFPAQAARRVGLSRVPLLCAREIPVPGSLPRVIRILAHCDGPNGQDAHHVYLEEARRLRADLDAAQ